MASISEKYRKTATAFFLLFYLAGAFQGPVLEALHFLSHWSQAMRQHHFHRHSEGNAGHHHHSILELVGDLLAPLSDEPASAEDRAGLLKKKFVECTAPPLSFASLPGVTSAKPQSQPFRPALFFPAVPAPPPRCVS